MQLTYRKAGVNIDLANMLVGKIKKFAPGIGGFSGLYPVNKEQYISASTDGVGTKLLIARELDKHDTIGIDLVAMNVNDVICSGARPLVFLDYFACGRLELKIAETVIKGIKKGCDISGCVLLGGETAEMPGMYKPGEYDLAGFTVGIVDKKNIIDGSKIRKGDIIIGIPSSGPHSNGYSLIRKALTVREIKKYGNALICPTRIYVKETLMLLKKIGSDIHAICHITGGGFYDNIVRLLPENRQARINKNSWTVPDIFRIIGRKGRVPEKEMYRTFNMGIGLVLIVKNGSFSTVKKIFKDAVIIGEISSGNKGVGVI